MFTTDDGYTLTLTVVDGRTFWTDGDMTFDVDTDGWPVDANGVRLDGVMG